MPDFTLISANKCDNLRFVTNCQDFETIVDLAYDRSDELSLCSVKTPLHSIMAAMLA